MEHNITNYVQKASSTFSVSKIAVKSDAHIDDYTMYRYNFCNNICLAELFAFYLNYNITFTVIKDLSPEGDLIIADNL